MPPRPDVDEHRHPDSVVECWWWWGSTADASAGWFVGLELHGRRFDYWAGLVRAGEPYLYVEELDASGLRGGLEIKPPEMWADHSCDVPHRQWSLGNEAYGVLLDDPAVALRRPFGERVPVAFDVEWYATDDPAVIVGGVPGADGYTQHGEFDARIELRDGIVALEGSAKRLHLWGMPHRPDDAATGDGLRAPYRRRDGTGVEQVLGPPGWSARTVALP